MLHLSFLWMQSPHHTNRASYLQVVVKFSNKDFPFFHYYIIVTNMSVLYNGFYYVIMGMDINKAFDFLHKR
ncbi:alcohol dehydrogenase [Sporosarcina newyorkensis 2681]|uniref:Alcohol dehydrogenase n=1 Tax=Sporosarcina newyorkensis 2681 TaxID=1027292 RepID=F9DSK9_9BACL|nr:alcohol dehydrogenase [Sporosarcina newyorkensis 2681]